MTTIAPTTYDVATRGNITLVLGNTEIAEVGITARRLLDIGWFEFFADGHYSNLDMRIDVNTDTVTVADMADVDRYALVWEPSMVLGDAISLSMHLIDDHILLIDGNVNLDEAIAAL